MPEPVALWAAETPCPAPESLSPPPGVVETVVHRADADYTFLHDCQIAMHRGVLFASWYNCPRKEMEDASVIRGRRSLDGGRNWGDVDVIAQAPDDAFMYVPNVFGECGGRLWCFALRMGAADRALGGLDAFRLDEATGRWEPLGAVAERFLPNHPPVHLADGRAVMAGRLAEREDDRPLAPALAISQGANWLEPWDVRSLLPPGETLPCPETTLLVEGHCWTAIIRPGDWVRGNPGRTALVSLSSDGGLTWTPPRPSTLPMQPSKAFAGVLSTGQRYLIANSPSTGPNGRELLTLSVSRPGESQFCRRWRLQDGPNAKLGCGPEWSYPCAIEADARLHVIYTSEKHHSVLSTVPVEALATSF